MTSNSTSVLGAWPASAPGTDSTPAVGVTTGTTPVMAGHHDPEMGTFSSAPGPAETSTGRGTNVRGGA